MVATPNINCPNYKIFILDYEKHFEQTFLVRSKRDSEVLDMGEKQTLATSHK
jgi:hypothetical protein